MRIERQSQTGQWVAVDADESALLIDKAASMEQRRGSTWAPVTIDELMRGLSRGAQPRYGTDWWMTIRSADVAEAKRSSAPTLRETGRMEDEAQAFEDRMSRS